MEVRAALVEFRATEGLPPDGLKDGLLDWGRAFGLPMPIPNIAARQPLIPYHDLHHLMTGYRTDEVGEAEIAAWTLASSGPSPALGTFYDRAAMLLGVIRAPGRVARAYARGRGRQNLYGQPLEALYDADVRALRAASGPADTRPTARDLLAWAGAIAVAGATVGAMPAAGLALALWIW